MSYRAHSTAGDAASTFLDISIPSGTLDGDILTMHVYIEVNLGLTISFSKGNFVKIAGASGQQTGDATDFEVYRYQARVAGESGTIRITWGGASLWNSAILVANSGRYKTGDAQDAPATFNAAVAPGTTATMLGLTTIHDSSDLLAFESDPAGSVHSWTAGLTEQADFGGQSFAQAPQASAGASGDKTVTINSVWWTGALIAYRIAGGEPANYLPLAFTQRML